MTGTIFSSQVFDRETASHYWLTVYCQDQELVPLSSHVEVYIEVTDENDNVPMTVHPIYYANMLEEDDRGGKHVVLIQAFDRDENPAQKFTFELTGGDPQNFFQIDTNTGTGNFIVLNHINNKIYIEKIGLWRRCHLPYP